MNKCNHCGTPFKNSSAMFCHKCKKPVGTKRKPALFDKPKKEKREPSFFEIPVREKTKARKREDTQVSDYMQEDSQSETGTEFRSDIIEPTPKAQVTKVPVQKSEPTPKEAAAEIAADDIFEKIPKKPDINYDGYYDDRQTDDDGQIKDSLDPEIIKRVAFIAGGAFILIILSAVVMYLLI